MSSNPDFDRWYAARNVKFILSPTHNLETFASTLVNYHVISELEDNPGKIRVREGRLEAHQPQVIAPHLVPPTMEGFGDEAREFLEFLRETEENLRILRYGYHLKSDNFSEQIVTDSLAVVTERVKAEVLARKDPFSAVLQAVDNPWDVSLVVLWHREVNRSAGKNIRELHEKGRLF